MVAKELQSRIAAEIARVKNLHIAELAALGECGTTFQVVIDGDSYDINTWSEPVPNDSTGTLAVLVGAWSKSLFGVSKRCYSGFVVTPEGTRTDIPESELWRYD